MSHEVAASQGAAPITNLQIVPRPEVVGFIDVIAQRRISGWVWDQNEPSRRLDVEIRFDGRPIATVRADRLRKDLADNGVGDGCYGFETQRETSIAEADSHRVSAVVLLDGDDYITLENRVARTVKNSVLAPDDILALRTAIESWPNEQRLLVDQLAQRLLPIAGEMHRLRSVIEASQQQNQQTVGPDALADLRRSHESLERRLAEIDVFHGRFDRALAALEAHKEGRNAPREDRTLRRVMFVLSVISGLSVAVGLVSVLG